MGGAGARRSRRRGALTPPQGSPGDAPAGPAAAPASLPQAPRRRPGRFRRLFLRPLIWTLLLLTAAVAGTLLFVQSRLVRERLAARLMAGATTALDRKVTIGQLDYTFFPLALELRDVVLPGPHAGDPPVARVSLVRAQVSWQDLRDRRLHLEQLDVVEPRLYLQLSPDGTTNLPRISTQGGSAEHIAFQIDRVLVQDGVFQLNDRRTPLALEAKALWGRLTGGAKDPTEQLGLLITAQDVLFTMPAARPYPLTLSLRGNLAARRGRLELGTVRLAGPDLAVAAHGTIDWHQGVVIALLAKADGQLHWLNRVGFMNEPIDGPVALDGRFERNETSWGYQGTAASSRLTVLRRTFRDATIRFDGNPRGVTCEIVKARYADGTLSGPVRVDYSIEARRRAGRNGIPVELDLGLADLAVEPLLVDQFPEQFAGPEGPIVELSGRVSGKLVYRFLNARFRAGDGRADLRIAAAEVAVPGGKGLKVAGSAPITIQGGILLGSGLQVTAPGQEGKVDGFRFDLTREAGRLDYRLVSRDTGALAPLFPPIPATATSLAHDAPLWLPATGHGVATGTVTIDPKGYSAHMDLDLADVSGLSLTADRMHGTLTLEPQAVENLRLEMSRGTGALLLAGRIPLPPKGKKTPTEPLRLEVSAAQWPAAEVATFLFPAIHFPGLAGGVSGQVELSGDFDHLSGRAMPDVTGLTLAGAAIGRVRGDVAFDPGRIAIERGVIESPAGVVLGRGSLDLLGDPAARRLEVTLDTPSGLSLAAAPLSDYLPAGLKGKVTLQAAAGGTLAHPHADVTVDGRDIELAGRALGNGTGAAGSTRALLSWDGESVRASGSLPGLLAFEGGGKLDRRHADLTLNLESQNLGGLARLAAAGTAAEAPLAELSGSLVGTAVLSADFAAGTYGGELRLADLRAELRGKKIANREPVVVTLSRERLEIRSLYLAEASTNTDLFVGGSIGLSGEKRLDLHLQSTLSAAWAVLFLPDISFDGGADLLATVRGTLAEPILNGEASLHGTRLVFPGFPNAIEEIDGTVLFNQDEVILSNLTARMAGGTLHGSGRVTLPRPGRPLSSSLLVEARNVTVRFADFLNRGDADLTFTASDSGRQIRGSVRLERAFYTENVELGTLQLLLRALQRGRVTVSATDSFMSNTQLNLEIKGPGALRVTNNVADAHGDIDLTVQGTLARPVVFGTVGLEPGGTLTYADNKYQIERGTLTFRDLNRIDPLIDLVLRTEVQNFDITLTLTGTINRLNAQFSSNADLADLEILALLTSGPRPVNEGRPVTPPDERQAGQVAAQSFLYGQAASALTQRVGTLFGFDRFRIDPLSTDTGTLGGVGFTVGKRLSKDVFVTYATDPSSTHQNILQVEWRLSSKVLLLLTQDGGGYAVDVQLERRF